MHLGQISDLRSHFSQVGFKHVPTLLAVFADKMQVKSGSIDALYISRTTEPQQRPLYIVELKSGLILYHYRKSEVRLLLFGGAPDFQVIECDLNLENIEEIPVGKQLLQALLKLFIAGDVLQRCGAVGVQEGNRPIEIGELSATGTIFPSYIAL